MENSLNPSFALITGASSGIGLELAKEFASHKINLIITARSTEKLNQLAADLIKNYQIQVICFTADLSNSNEVRALYDFTKEKKLLVEYLVNNAGFGSMGNFYEGEWSNELEMINLNITALTNLTKLYLKEMVSAGIGKILNVASTAAFQPGPLMSVYYASKSYVLSFTEGIAEELKGTGVTITASCPGPTKSGFQAKADIENSRILKSLPIATSVSVAKYGFKAMMNGTVVAVPGLMNKIGALSPRFTPRSWARKITKSLHLSVNK